MTGLPSLAAKPGGMKDQSQLDEMRAAIRGDIERGRTRPRPSPVVQVEPEPEAEREQPIPEVLRPRFLSSFFKRD